VLGAASLLGMSGNHLYLLMRRFDVPLPPRVTHQVRPRQPSEKHPDTVVVVAEMVQLRTQVRLLIRRPGSLSAQQMLAIEARHRYLRQLLRSALGEAEASETRGRSPAVGLPGIAGLT
jgi:hypothetical protein